jgi:hypothetical protein
MLNYSKASNTLINKLSTCAFVLLMLVLLLNGVTFIKTNAQDSTWPPLPAPIIFFDSRENLIYVDPYTPPPRPHGQFCSRCQTLTTPRNPCDRGRPL